jgi:hypothetical protein
MTVTDSVVRLAGIEGEFRLSRGDGWGLGDLGDLCAWLGPTFAAKGAAKMGHPRRWRFRLAALWRDSRGGRRHMSRYDRSVPLLVSSLMVQSISLWGCAGLGRGAGQALRLALSADRYRSSRLGRFAGGGGEPLAYS